MKLITVQNLKNKLKKKEPIQLIDVREPYEHENGAIDEVNIPLGLMLEEKDKISKNIPVVIYCQSGNRAAAIIYMLEKEFGMDNLYSLDGGYQKFNETK